MISDGLTLANIDLQNMIFTKKIKFFDILKSVESIIAFNIPINGSQ